MQEQLKIPHHLSGLGWPRKEGHYDTGTGPSEGETDAIRRVVRAATTTDTQEGAGRRDVRGDGADVSPLSGRYDAEGTEGV